MAESTITPAPELNRIYRIDFRADYPLQARSPWHGGNLEGFLRLDSTDPKTPGLRFVREGAVMSIFVGTVLWAEAPVAGLRPWCVASDAGIALITEQVRQTIQAESKAKAAKELAEQKAQGEAKRQADLAAAEKSKAAGRALAAQNSTPK